jgi:S-formylglutathione hydrolase FrmB
MKKTAPLLLAASLIFTAVFSQQFKISYSSAIFNKPFNGRVILYLNKENKKPKDGAVTIEPFPCFSVEVKNGQPGVAVTIDDKADAFPVKLSDIERGEYYVQAVWDRNLGGRAISESPGNLYSKPVKLLLDKDFSKSFSIFCDQQITEPGFTQTKYVKELKVSSAVLSAFIKKPMTVDAAVILPEQYYKEPDRKFPVLFLVSGYGGDYHHFSGDTVNRSQPIDSFACITVYLDGNCALGHSVYANSDNNGPWGDALVKEFIPGLERSYRCDGARLLRGHSSGGWTVLWLQTHYPDIFTACWSSSPDPVDFRSFQQINLYAGDNLFYDKDSALRLVATVAGHFPWASQKQAYQQEFVIYRGEQMHSFDAVFSEKGADGNPESICNHVTGDMNRQVFEHWKKYDISLYLRSNWPALEKDLKGKIRVSVGEQDNFLLNWAVHLLDGEMRKLDTEFEFGYYPGDHFTVSSTEYRHAGQQFLARKYSDWKKNQGK